MDKKLRYGKYNKDEAHSYTLGAFPTMELILNRAEAVLEVLYHSDFRTSGRFDEVEEACRERKLVFREASKQVERLRDKDKCLVIGVFNKYGGSLDPGAHHLVLVSPMDMGNLGTILRTALGFHFRNVALIGPCCDPFHPKVLRSSMGALFKLNLEVYEGFEAYMAAQDAGVRDAEVHDSGACDVGARDAEVHDSGARDAASHDSEARDAGARDSGARDAASHEAEFHGVEFHGAEFHDAEFHEAERAYYPFMLPAETELAAQTFEGRGPKSLVFGNESSGLDESFRKLGSPTVIAHSDDIDSLNLALAVGIALYDFHCKVGNKLL